MPARRLPYWSHGRLAGWAILMVVLLGAAPLLQVIASAMPPPRSPLAETTPRALRVIVWIIWSVSIIPMWIAMGSACFLMLLSSLLSWIILNLDGITYPCPPQFWSDPVLEQTAGGPHYSMTVTYELDHETMVPIKYVSASKPVHNKTRVVVQVHPNYDWMHRFPATIWSKDMLYYLTATIVVLPLWIVSLLITVSVYVAFGVAVVLPVGVAFALTTTTTTWRPVLTAFAFLLQWPQSSRPLGVLQDNKKDQWVPLR